MKHVALAAAVMVFGSSALGAARIEAPAASCAGLQAAVAANGFVFVNSPRFQDFAVANAYYCTGDDRLELRTVATNDNPQCVLRYCASGPNFEAE